MISVPSDIMARFQVFLNRQPVQKQREKIGTLCCEPDYVA